MRSPHVRPEPLDRDAFLELMRTTGLGRVAWTAEDGRVVEPVTSPWTTTAWCFRTGEGDKLEDRKSVV